MNHSSQPHVAGSCRLLHGVVAALLAGFAIGPAMVGAAPVSPALIYGIDNDNDIYEVDPVSKTATLVLLQATEGGCPTRSRMTLPGRISSSSVPISSSSTGRRRVARL